MAQLSNHQPDIDRLRTAHAKVANLFLEDSTYAPLFKRLDDSLKNAEAALSGDIIARARAAVHQMANV